MQELKGTGEARTPLLAIIALTLLSLFLADQPGIYQLLTPVRYFTTNVHELGHAITCVATGGHVSGMTIVSDGDGHGGLTFCAGGWQFAVNQMGYLGAAIAGCIMLWLASYPKLARSILYGIAIALAAGAIAFISPALTAPGYAWQALMSLLFALAGAGALAALAHWGNSIAIQFTVLFLAVQTALNALTDVFYLVKIELGMTGAHSFSDATNQAALTGLPASFWSVLWGGLACFMLYKTIKQVYGKRS